MSLHIDQGERYTDTHHDDVDGERHTKTEILADKKFSTTDGLGEYRINRTFLDLFRNECDADEDRDERTEQEDRVKPDVDDRTGFVSIRQIAEKYRARDDEENEDYEIVEHTIAHCLTKGVPRNGYYSTHGWIKIVLRCLRFRATIPQDAA